jgi:hypothetical protein
LSDQVLALFVSDRLGGPGSDLALMEAYAAATMPVKEASKSVLLQLGSLTIGTSRQRGLLFKALGDALSLQSMLLKGEEYAGHEGAAACCVTLQVRKLLMCYVTFCTVWQQRL